MSQEKVDRNKAAKASRKKDMQKEKTKLATIRVCAVALCAAIIGWGVIPLIRDRLLIRLLKRLKWMLPHLQITRIR